MSVKDSNRVAVAAGSCGMKIAQQQQGNKLARPVYGHCLRALTTCCCLVWNLSRAAVARRRQAPIAIAIPIFAACVRNVRAALTHMICVLVCVCACAHSFAGCCCVVLLLLCLLSFALGIINSKLCRRRRRRRCRCRCLVHFHFIWHCLLLAFHFIWSQRLRQHF